MKRYLLLVISCVLCNIVFAQGNVIDRELEEVMKQRSDKMIGIDIILKSQVDAADLNKKAARSHDKAEKRSIVVNELKRHAEGTQADIMAILEAEERSGRVANIRSLWIANTINCEATKEVIYKLSSHPDIAVIGYEKEVQLLDDSKVIEMDEAPDTRGGGAAPHVIQVNADDVWNQGYTGKNVIVAVLDSGTNINHYDLKDHLWLGYIDTDDDGNPDTYVNGWNCINNSSNVIDDFGHGTHCAGIVCGDGTVGNTVGMAPDATLMTLKIVNRAGGGSVAQMLSGVQFAVENGADVLSMSLGFKNNQVTAEQKKNIRQAFDNVLEAGVVVCAASGNDGESYVALENVDYPAACPSPWMNPDQQAINDGGVSSVICVGNVNANNNLVASSSRGPVTWQDVDTYNDYPYNGTTELGLIRPDICAPGDWVYSLKHDQVNKYKYMTGTSQATPGVAGVIALMLEKNSNLTPAQICEIIETEASNKPAIKNNQVGSGVIDALAAVNTVTADNSKPYLKITRQSPTSIANGDGKVLNITLTNQGKGTCENGNATLTTNDQYVTITNATTSLGTINVNGSTDLSFTINLSTETPNGHTAAFTLTSTDETLTWSESFTIKIDSYAKVLYQSCQTAELTEGENTLSVKMINKGTVATTQNTDVKLTTNSSFVTINNNVSTLGTMNVGEEKTATFTVTVNDGTPDHTNINFDLYSTPNNYLETRNITYEFESELDEYGNPTDGFNGWTTFDNSNDGRNHPWWHSQNAETHRVDDIGSYHSGGGQLVSETYCLASMQLYTKPIDNFLVSPKIKATADSKFSFFARAHYNFPGERFQVAVSEASNNIASDFTTLNSYVINDANNYYEWKEYTVDLSAYAGKEIYVAIRHYFTEDEWTAVDGGYNTYLLHIDDVTLYDVIDISDNFKYDNYSYFSITVKADPLPAPTNVTATANGTSTINLSWDAVTHAQKYNIYRDGEYLTYVTTTSYTDNNLTHNTQYCYEVAAVYSGYEYEKSASVCATTVQKDYSAVVEVTPQTFDVNGETTIPLKLTITNDGKYRFKARANYTLSSENTYVTITNNATTDLISALQPGASVVKTINVTVKEDIPNNSVINFNLNILSLVVDPNQPEYFAFDIPFDVDVYNPLRAPKNVVVKNPGANFVPLVWDAAPKATSYDVYRNGEKITNTSLTMYVDNGLEKETTYCYKVKSVKGDEVSDFSDEICETTPKEDNGIVVQSFNLTENGEFATLTAIFTNKSNTATAETTTATLVTEDSYVTIVDGTYALGSIGAGETATAEFSVKIDITTPENHDLVFYTIVEDYYNSISVTPAEPEPVELTATVNGVDEVNLSWNNVARAESYNIYRNNALLTNTTETSYTDNSVIHNTTYYYKVVAVSNDVEYGFSDVVSVTTEQKDYSVAIETSPATVDVLGLTTLAVNFTIFNDGANTIDATYTLTSDNETYVTIVNGTGNIEALQYGAEINRTVDVKIDRDVTDGSVITFNLNLSSQNFSINNPFEIKVNNPSRVPENLVVNSSTDAYSLTLSWDAVTNATSYNIYRDGEFIGNTTSTTYTDNGLNTETSYCYQVASIIGTVESDFSIAACGTTSTMEGHVIVQSYEITENGNTLTLTTILVNNSGSATPEGTTATLKCEDQYVTITSATAEVGILKAEATKDVTFTMKLADNTPSNYELNFDVIVEYIGEGDEVSNKSYTFDNDLQGWTTMTSDDHSWYHSSLQSNHGYSKSYSSGGFIFSESYCNENQDGFNPNHWIVIPETIVVTDDTRFYFSACSMSSSIASNYEYLDETFGVYVSTTNNTNTEAFTEIQNWTLERAESSSNMATKSVALTEYEGQSIWVAIRHYGAGDNAALAVDNVVIDNIIQPVQISYTSSLSATVNKSLNMFTGIGSWATADNWSKGSVPTSTDDVIIKGKATIESGNLTVNSLMVYNENSLTINDGAKLTVNSSLVNTDADALIINDGAQIFQNNDNVAATFNMGMTNPSDWGSIMNKDGWQFISSPVKNANTADFAPENDYDLFKYDGTQERQWINYKGHSTTDFEATFQQGRGYLASYQNETTASFSGILNNETSFVFSELKDYDEQDRFNNFYLLGNPFSFNMNWANVTAENIYDGGFAIVNNSGSYEYHGANSSVNVGDGFMVLITEGSPSLSYGAAKGQRNRETEVQTINLIATGNEGKDNLIISLDGAEDKGFNKLDNFNSAIAEIYVANNGSRYAIMSYDQDVTEIPVSFDAKQMGNYTIAAQPQGKFQSVILVDRFTGVETNLLLEDYTFTATGSENHDRFIVKLANSQEPTANSNFAYVSGEDLIINAEGTVQIIDMMGRVVYSDDVESTNNRINVSDFDNAAYVIRVVNENGVKVQKIIL